MGTDELEGFVVRGKTSRKGVGSWGAAIVVAVASRDFSITSARRVSVELSVLLMTTGFKSSALIDILLELLDLDVSPIDLALYFRFRWLLVRECGDVCAIEDVDGGPGATSLDIEVPVTVLTADGNCLISRGGRACMLKSKSEGSDSDVGGNRAWEELRSVICPSIPSSSALISSRCIVDCSVESSGLSACVPRGWVPGINACILR